jgi:hypothetical protein
VSLFFVPVIAATLYTALGMRQGTTMVEGEKVVWVRYVTWFTTTPLLLLQLCRLVHARQSVVLGLLVSNQFMIADGAGRRAVGDAAQLGVVRDQLGGLRVHPAHPARRPHARGPRPPGRRADALPPPARREHRDLDRLPDRLGARHQGLRDHLARRADAGYVLLDLASKVGFGMLVLSGAGALERSGTLAGLAQRRSLRRDEPEDVRGAAA